MQFPIDDTPVVVDNAFELFVPTFLAGSFFYTFDILGMFYLKCLSVNLDDVEAVYGKF